jgi:hypothetical protein
MLSSREILDSIRDLDPEADEYPELASADLVDGLMRSEQFMRDMFAAGCEDCLTADGIIADLERQRDQVERQNGNLRRALAMAMGATMAAIGLVIEGWWR